MFKNMYILKKKKLYKMYTHWSYTKKLNREMNEYLAGLG